jgi:hypothetical protein
MVLNRNPSRPPLGEWPGAIAFDNGDRGINQKNKNT